MRKLLDVFTTPAWLLLLAHATCLAQSQSSVDVLTEGHWLEVRGSYQSDGSFLAQRVDLVQPSRYESLIGTISRVQQGRHFTLLGQRVEVQEKTDFGRVDRNALQGMRVKVEGYYRSEERFSARKISPRGEGRERITGRIDDTRRTGRGIEASIMGYRVLIPGELPVRHELRLSGYALGETRVQAIVDRNRDEDDLFGKGVWVTDKLLLAGQVTARGIMENDFDLDAADPADRNDLEGYFRARAVFQPTSSFFAVAELFHRQLIRDDDVDGSLTTGDTRPGETYLYWIDPFGIGLDFQIGRADFDDEREWLYDQNLDTLRAIWTGNNIRAELSYSETLANGNLVDEAAANSMLYISNNDDDRHLAGYVIHRDFDLPVPVQRTHYGLRAFGEWLPHQESWVEIAYMDGSIGQIDNRGWAFDIGSTWQIHDRFALTLGYAMGQGDDPQSTEDNTFRQSGLQDNNAKFAGVTSFRYYGELVDPELANLEILTAGLGWLPRKGISLDLVGHSYKQNELSLFWVDSDIDGQPNGIDPDLGLEVDLVLGWRTGRQLDLEVVAAWFSPGDAFNAADDAYLGKLQFRYRF
ncbi:MAG: alginate export family protein [Woeseia sp.]